MPGSIGNKNSSLEKRAWGNAIRRAIAQSDGARLRAIAEKLLDKAEEGDITAMKELGDRLDGKATQAVELGGADGGPLVVTWKKD